MRMLRLLEKFTRDRPMITELLPMASTSPSVAGRILLLVMSMTVNQLRCSMSSVNPWLGKSVRHTKFIISCSTVDSRRDAILLPDCARRVANFRLGSLVLVTRQPVEDQGSLAVLEVIGFVDTPCVRFKNPNP